MPTSRRILPALAAVFLLSVTAHADDPATMEMYRRYEPHLQTAPHVGMRPIVSPQPGGQPYARTSPAISDMSGLPSMHGEAGFNTWLSGYKRRASAQGLDPQFLNRALAETTFLPRVIELDGKQPESKITFAKYKSNIVTDARIRDGRAKYAEHRALLERASQVYGVPPQYIVALWGIETNYGRITGGFDIISSLATLAYEGRRAAFFEEELTKALKILAGGHAGTDRLTGSWAGAMGQCQFMPSSYMRYGVDGNGDGNINIWSSMPDVFASMANYLHTEGWNKDLKWGREVVIPDSIGESEIGRDKKKPLSYWRQRGVRSVGHNPIPQPTDGADPMAALVAPDGLSGPIYLVYQNYDVIMHWNRSTYFATSVGLLADAIASSD